MTTAADVVLGLVVAATLESVLGLSLGCKAFAGLIRLRIIPDEDCERCSAVSFSGGS